MQSTGARVRAARGLAGIASQRELARRAAMNRLSERTLREVEADRRGLEPHEAARIADVCGVTPEWFTVPDLGAAVKLGAAVISERDATGAAEAARTVDDQDQQQLDDDESRIA